MQSSSQGTPSPQERRDQEVRAAVDVMFEALSHIQASLGADTEKERVRTYRRFKEALYERFEHAVEKRREEGLVSEQRANGRHGDSSQNGTVEEPTSDTDSEDDDTLGKLWPTIADRNGREE